jgi:chaperonin GroES
MKVSPMNNRLIIEINKKEETTKSGLVIPESANKIGDNMGVVVSVGPGMYSPMGTLIPMRVKVGDKVCFNVRAMQKENLNASECFYHIAETDVTAIIEE